ncbi:OLC1v1036061C1 [Oldenlandia corymbosa var. corymbosa]|uniref:OLC1v1036061C1 n=1 Tax=Oldenlandia corymbosa var. corymbosa TaxID=529605 RepID=A0AAV1CVU7_OLDCO|nr:OLC1v1036061C1 [Oldenlandia corymbosa var. corymbosa]
MGFVYVNLLQVDAQGSGNDIAQFGNYNGPFALMGDFNQILNSIDKKSGSKPNRKVKEDLRGMLRVLDVAEIKHRGVWFTWSDGRKGNEEVKERLDRAFANSGWLSLFDQAILENMPNYAIIPWTLRVYGRSKGQQGSWSVKFPGNCYEALDELHRQSIRRIDVRIKRLMKELEETQMNGEEDIVEEEANGFCTMEEVLGMVDRRIDERSRDHLVLTSYSRGDQRRSVPDGEVEGVRGRWFSSRFLSGVLADCRG